MESSIQERYSNSACLQSAIGIMESGLRGLVLSSLRVPNVCNRQFARELTGGNMPQFKPLYGASIVLLPLLIAPGLLKAEASPSDADEVSLAEVVVTAQKRSENLEKVPVAVTAVTERTLAQLGADDFSDFARTVPGLAFQELGPEGYRGQVMLSIRGISSYGGIATTYGYYIDDTPVAPINVKLFDINRVEVLRGPQGTLYGAGSMGGTIKYVTNQPDATQFSAATDAELSSTEHGNANGPNYAADGMINLPLITNTLALRVVGSFRDEDGYIDRVGLPDGRPQGASEPLRRDVNIEHTQAVRAMLSYTPTDRFRLDARIMYQDIYVPDFGTFDAGSAAYLTKERDVAEPNEDKFTLYSLTGRYDFGGAELFATSSYLNKRDDSTEEITGLTDAVFGPTVGMPLGMDTIYRNRIFTNEVRLASKGERRLTWLIGTFYESAPDFNSVDQLAVDTTLPDPPVANGVAVFTHRIAHYKELGAFADATFALTDKLKLEAGVRYYDIEQHQVSITNGTYNGHSTIPIAASGNGINPKYTLSYQLTPDRMLYASASKGYRPGGGNAPLNLATCSAQLAALGLTQAPSQYNADFLWSYELGAKTTWLDRRIVANVAVYDIDWNDIQQAIRLPAPCGGGWTNNVGKARSSGAEVELDLLPIDNLQITLMYSSIDAVLKAAVPSIKADVGDPILQVPKTTYSASAEYGFPLPNQLHGYIRADYQYVGSRDQSFIVSPTQVLPAYDVANARIGVQKDKWDAALFVDNVFDVATYLNDITDGAVPVRKIVTMRPRTVGLKASYRF